jgi:hypothetical protein
VGAASSHFRLSALLKREQKAWSAQSNKASSALTDSNIITTTMLQQFYERKDPDKVSEADSILAYYSQQDLRAALLNKYGTVPLSPSASALASTTLACTTDVRPLADFLEKSPLSSEPRLPVHSVLMWSNNSRIVFVGSAMGRLYFPDKAVNPHTKKMIPLKFLKPGEQMGKETGCYNENDCTRYYPAGSKPWEYGIMGPDREAKTSFIYDAQRKLANCEKQFYCRFYKHPNLNVKVGDASGNASAVAFIDVLGECKADRSFATHAVNIDCAIPEQIIAKAKLMLPNTDEVDRVSVTVSLLDGNLTYPPTQVCRTDAAVKSRGTAGVAAAAAAVVDTNIDSQGVKVATATTAATATLAGTSAANASESTTTTTATTTTTTNNNTTTTTGTASTTTSSSTNASTSNPSQPQNVQRKYGVAVCTMFYQQDCEELREWLEYHRLVGVEHFYIYVSCNLPSFSPFVSYHHTCFALWDFCSLLLPDLFVTSPDLCYYLL